MTTWPQRTVRLDFHLLDRQIITADNVLYGNVDDLELAEDSDGRPYVTAILVGQQALGQRLRGRLGNWMADVARRLHPKEHPDPIRIPIEQVSTVDSAIHLSVPAAQLVQPPFETWLSEKVIGRIPGASHESQ